MHPDAIQLAKDIYQEYLKGKGYRFVANTFRYEFSGGCVISRLRGCSKFNRDDASRWRFQVDSKILFDDLDYDPQHSPVGPQPHGRYAGGLYNIEDNDKTKPRRIAEDISHLTDRLLAERDVIRAAFAHRIDRHRTEEGMRQVARPKRVLATEREELPTGKIIVRRFSRNGSVIEAQHFYGNLEIGIKCFFKAGVKTDEMYFSKTRLVSRRVYEKARTEYEDMPPADQKSEDWGGQLLKSVR